MKRFNIIRFYEEIIHNLKKEMTSSDIVLVNKEITSSYEIAKIVTRLARETKLYKIPTNMDIFLTNINYNYYLLNNNGLCLGVLCALFHNIGYIIQIKNYHKIDDNIKDNQELGLFYLIESKVLKDLSIEEQIVIYEVVHNHNRECLSYVDGCSKFYVELIKEAKLIYNNSIKQK